MGRQSAGMTPGRLVYRNTSLRILLRTAFALQAPQIIGGPSWLDTSTFDIEAKVPGTPTGPELMLMLQNLLRERFRLVASREMRTGTTYALVVAHTDKPLGPDLKPAVQPCQPAAPCGGVRPIPGATGMSLQAADVPMAQLAKILTNYVGNSVEDKTNLSGNYDLTLTWSGGPEGPAIFTAVQEQLGLRLQPGKGTVEVLVIESASKPTEN